MAGQVLQTNTDCLINMVNNSGQLNTTTQEMSENWEVKLHQSLVIQLFSTMKYGYSICLFKLNFSCIFHNRNTKLIGSKKDDEQISVGLVRTVSV